MMATAVVGSPRAGSRISWGAIFSGTIVTLGVWLLLHTLGLAAGLTAIDPKDQGSLRGIGIGTGIWSVIVPLLALFAGGFVAAYTANLFDRTAGAIHGLVVWGLTALSSMILVLLALATTVRAGMQAASAGAGAMAAAGPSLDELGINMNQLMGPVNQRLQQQGLPPVAPDQIRAAAADALRGALATGRLDREALTGSLARNTNMTQAEAQQMATQIENQWNQRAAEFRQDALTAADRTGKALWGVFLALLLGAGAATGGGLLGVGRGRQVVEPTPVTSVGGPVRHIPAETHS